MKTKYILHGGKAQQINDKNDRFFEEILKDTGDLVKVLLVEFAGKDERKDLNVEIDSGQFERVRGNKRLVFDVANEDDFPGQIKRADVVYIGGGATAKLMETLKKYIDLGTHFAGKTVAGESAGANCLSTYGYSKLGGGVMRGLGLVPVKMWPHYKAERNEEFESISNGLETLLLKDHEYKVFQI